MTREEAKGNLIHAIKWNDMPKKEALDMAVKALEKEPCENAICREDALMALTGEWTEITDEIIHRFIKRIKALPPVTLRLLNPEADREKSKAYCAECDHIEMCSWYPHDGCEWLKTDRYNAGYNAAKREIALSGEYERAYERGKADAQPKTGKWIEERTYMECPNCHDIWHYEENQTERFKFCPTCGR